MYCLIELTIQGEMRQFLLFATGRCLSWMSVNVVRYAKNGVELLYCNSLNMDAIVNGLDIGTSFSTLERES